MGLTSLPTKTDGSLGRVKTDELPFTRPDTQVPAAELERIKTALIDVCTEVGINSGTGSNLNARMALLEAAPTSNWTGTLAAPTANDDETQGWAVGSWWFYFGEEDPDSGLYICIDASTGAAQWLLLYPPEVPEPSDENPQPLGTASPGSSEEFSRADHVHEAPAAPEPPGYSIGVTITDLSVDFATLEDRTIYQVNLGPGDTCDVSIGDNNPSNPSGKLVGFIQVGAGTVEILGAGAMTVSVLTGLTTESAGPGAVVWVLITGVATAAVYGQLV